MKNDKMKRYKILYILTIIFLAIATTGGIAALIGVFSNFKILTTIGSCLMLISYGISLLLEFINRKDSKKYDK